jgi:ribosomal RNA-processing protein 12
VVVTSQIALLQDCFAARQLNALVRQQSVICNGITNLVASIDTGGGLELENASADVDALAAASAVLLPILFKFVTDAHDVATSGSHESMDVEEASAKPSDVSMESLQKVQCVTEAISALARLATNEFLRGLFKKLMHRLLEEIQSETGDKEKVCALLTLSQALVTSRVLDVSSVSFLYRAVKPLIRNDEDGPRVQKRAYKVLTEICERYHLFVADKDRLQEVIVLLSGTVTTSQVSSRHMRLKCLNIIVDGLDSSSSPQLVRLLVGCCSDSNERQEILNIDSLSGRNLQSDSRDLAMLERFKWENTRRRIPAPSFVGITWRYC